MRKVEGLQWTALEAAEDKTKPNVKHFQPDSQGTSMYLLLNTLCEGHKIYWVENLWTSVMRSLYSTLQLLQPNTSAENLKPTSEILIFTVWTLFKGNYGSGQIAYVFIIPQDHCIFPPQRETIYLLLLQ